MPIVTFFARNCRIEVPAGTTILEAARLAGLDTDAPCDGSGTCGKCLVQAGEAAPGGLRREGTGHGGELPPGTFLACQTMIDGHVWVRLPEGEEVGLRVHDRGLAVAADLAPFMDKVRDHRRGVTLVMAGSEPVAEEPGDSTDRLFGLAVDIGTTTLVVAVVDLRTGRALGVAGDLNPQARHGQDVLSRIRFASEDGGLARLHGDLAGALNRLAAQAASTSGITTDQLYEAVLGGNTCMLHLALGIDPAPLGKYPYTPDFRGGLSLPAAQAGLKLARGARVYPVPALSGYVGGDITAGIVATGLAERPGVTLFVDIGTNGEMVLARNGKLTATSTAAGPAFEGANISCGMRASRGAIETFEVLGPGRVRIATIDNASPAGLCGSGLLDVVAELAAHGGVLPGGRLAPANGHPLSPFVAEDGGKLVLRLADGVSLTQKDIRQVQLAKGAVRAGIERLLADAGITAPDVDRVVIAGSFGFHLRAQSLVRIGLLPPQLEDRVEFAGNTSRAGAQLLLLDRFARDRAAALAGTVRILELADDPEFEKTFVASLAFPAPAKS